MTLFMGIIPGLMLPPGFRASCTSLGIRKDSLYQISNSAKQSAGALNRAVMTEETRVGCFWLPTRGSDRTSVLLNSQTGPQNSPLLSFNLLEKLVKKDRAPSAVPRQAAARPCCLRGDWDAVAGPGDSPLGLWNPRGSWPRGGTAPASRRHGAIQLGS